MTMARKLGLWSGVGIVIANMIGAGVLTTPGFMAMILAPSYILLAWLGFKVHGAVDKLAVLGSGVHDSGQVVQDGFDRAADAVDGVPVVGGELGDALHSAGEGTGGNVAQAGSGPPLLLVHGWPQHWWSWRKVIPTLAERYRVLAVDLRGWGWSDAPAGAYAKQTFADIRGVAGDIRQVMADARGPLRDFARSGLPELLLLISDARQMIGTIDRAAQRFESSPSSILFGDKASEYNPGGK